MMTTMVLANPSVLSHSYHFFFVVRTLKIYSLSKFQIHNTVLLTIVPMLSNRSPERVHLLTGSLYPLTNGTQMIFKTMGWVKSTVIFLFCFSP